MRRNLALFTTAAFGLVLTTHAAAAGVEIGTVVVGGTGRSTQRALATGAVTAVVRDAGWSLAEKPFSKQEASEVIGCATNEAPSACLPRAVSLFNINRLIIISVDDDKDDHNQPMIVLTGRVVIPDGDIVIRGDRTCTRCGDDKITQLAAELTRDLLHQLQVRLGKTVLSIKSTPSGAAILLDGDKVGVTDSTYPTYPGKHTVAIQLDGYKLDSRDVNAIENQTTEIDAKLESTKPPTTLPTRSAPTTSDDEPGGLRPRLPWILGAVGVVATGAGVALVLANEPEVVDNRVSARARPTLVHGLITLGVGAVAFGASGYFFLNPAPAPATAPPAHGGSAGVIMGIGGRF